MARNNDEEIAKLVVRGLSDEKLVGSRDFMYSLMEFRSKEKLRSTYSRGIKKALINTETGRVYPNYRFDGTETGRLSCGGYKAGKASFGPSYHTLPRPTEDSSNIRAAFRAEPGYWYMTADYSTMELRVLAHESQDENMLRAFWSGEDLHTYTAHLIFRKPIEQITKNERQIAKSASFLIVYGGGPAKLAKEVNISLARAKKVLSTYQKTFPGVFTWMDEIKEFLRENLYVETMFGRRRHLANIKSKVDDIRLKSERQGINTMIQSPASDILVYALYDLENELDLWDGVEVLATVHDSIEGQARPDVIFEACQMFRDKMINCYSMNDDYPEIQMSVPFQIEMMIGPSFGNGIEAHFNDLGEVTNKDEVIAYFAA